MTFDELKEKFPHCNDDLRMAYYPGPGCDNRDCLFKVSVESMDKWAEQARDIARCFEGDEEHEERILAIMECLRDGGEQYPVFCFDGRVCEGNHRLIAAYRLGLPTLTVVDTDWDAMDAQQYEPNVNDASDNEHQCLANKHCACDDCVARLAAN